MIEPDPAAKAHNAELFTSAVASMRETEGEWRLQLKLVLGHETELVMDYDSLGGCYERIRPFIHHALGDAMAAIVQLRFAPQVGGLLVAAVNRLVISAAGQGEPCRAMLADGTLALQLPLVDGGLGGEVLANIIRPLLMSPPQAKAVTGNEGERSD